MRGVIEKPGEEVGGNIEEGGEDGGEGEIRDAGHEVATSEEDEAKKSEEGAEIYWYGAMPAVGGEDVEGDSDSVEADDEEEERNEGENEVKDDKRSSEPGKGEDGAFVLGTGETEEVDDLGGEENDQTELGDVIEGEDDVRDAGREHGEDEEEVFREGTGGIDEAKDDAPDAEKDEEVVFRGEEAEDDVDKHEDAPEDGPDR